MQEDNKKDISKINANLVDSFKEEIGVHYKDIVTAPIPTDSSLKTDFKPTAVDLRIEELLRSAQSEREFVAAFQAAYEGPFQRAAAKLDPKDVERYREKLRQAHVPSYDWRVGPGGPSKKTEE
jgi:hypothetical protein